ncbi:hypothetical protein [Flavobacterium granuli]|uniref:YcxB-like protein n=1 Tax=Flavobacterium granuli TaxID=280093 RepID=A0A1M5RBX0_9FLAO|nr:hypothetical protein [Flavobacterium granuli]PRZ21682.1 hypothetical protein BC624_108122 [Flavobacterium granuli]SHH23620.1 hypothetical protein SAMN05443373_109121 [Flavobacterium granuli]
MSVKIDKKKSVEKERLIFKPNWEYILEKAYETFIYLGWTIATIAVILNPKNAINHTATLIVILINILLLISWYYIYKLLKINISKPERDRKLFVEILKNRFPELIINDNGLHMLRSKKNTGSLSWGKLLTVIFDENYLFINLATLGRYGNKSPFHAISNYLKLKSIEKEFNNRIVISDKSVATD